MGRMRAVLIILLGILVVGCGLRGARGTIADLEAAYNEAQDAIAHAESLGAGEHAPQLLKLAKNRLEEIRERQLAAPAEDILDQYRYVEKLAQRSTTQSIETRVQQIQSQQKQKTSELEPRVDQLESQISELSDTLNEDGTPRGPSQSTLRKIRQFQDTVAQISSLRDEVESLRERLEGSRPIKSRPLEEKFTRSTKRIQLLCREVESLRTHMRILHQSTVAVAGYSSAFPLYDTSAMNLTSYWAFDDTGTASFDDLATGIPARNLGTSTDSEGILGSGSMNVSGYQEFLAVLDNPGLDPGDNPGFSVSGWFKTKDLDQEGHLVSKWDPENEKGWYVSVSPSEAYFYMDSGDSTVKLSSNNNYVDGTWHHFAANYDSSTQTVQFLIDGREVNSINGSFDFATDIFLSIGGSPTKRKYYEGRIDEIRIFNRALDREEIYRSIGRSFQIPEVCSRKIAGYDVGSDTELKTTIKPEPKTEKNKKRKPDQKKDEPYEPPGLIAYWSMDGKVGRIVRDTIGEEHGERFGVKTGDSGVLDTALSFDGEGDRVRVADDWLFDRTDQFTLSAWVYPSDYRYQPIITKGISRSSAQKKNSPYSLALTENGDVVFSLRTENGLTEVRSVGYKLNKWQYVVATFDGKMAKLYVNGEEKTKFKLQEGLIENNLPVLIGGELRTDSGFRGKIDEVGIYDRRLSLEKIRRRYKSVFSLSDYFQSEQKQVVPEWFKN